MTNYSFNSIPRSRIATWDFFSIGKKKNHIYALLECDVSEGRHKIRQLRKEGKRISFNAWIIKVISNTIILHPEVASFIYNRKKLIVFKNVNISILVEKEMDGKKVPIPLVLEKTEQKSIEEISIEIEKAKEKTIDKKYIVIQEKSKSTELIYYYLPGFLRRFIIEQFIKSPKSAFNKMGNVVITSLGMFGHVNGWFITKSAHPLSFGLGSVIKKPIVKSNEIAIREILNFTVLFDHDVIDGGPIARFVNDLTKRIESGYGL